jgi:hypothetical protein
MHVYGHAQKEKKEKQRASRMRLREGKRKVLLGLAWREEDPLRRVVLRCFLPSPRGALPLFRVMGELTTCLSGTSLSAACTGHGMDSSVGRSTHRTAATWGGADRSTALLVFLLDPAGTVGVAGRACTIACSQPTMPRDDVFRPRPAGQCCTSLRGLWLAHCRGVN